MKHGDALEPISMVFSIIVPGAKEGTDGVECVI